MQATKTILGTVALIGALSLSGVPAHSITLTSAFAMTTSIATLGKEVVVPEGTEVVLRFAQPLSSKIAKVGQRVKFTVKENLTVDGKTVLRKGTSVTGLISKVDKRNRFGVNARMRIVLNPVRVAGGAMMTLETRNKGNQVGGKTAEAGAASVGAAIVLGPVGLIGGYFVVGKNVNVKIGDPLITEVAHDVIVRTK